MEFDFNLAPFYAGGKIRLFQTLTSCLQKNIQRN